MRSTAALFLCAVASCNTATSPTAPNASAPARAAELAPRALPAPAANGAEVTLEEIFQDQQWVARSPERPAWSASGTAVFYERARPDSSVSDRFRYDTATRATTLVADEDAACMLESLVVSPDRSATLGVAHGDLFLVERSGTHQLTRSTAAVSSPRWSTDGRSIFFLSAGAWWRIDRAGSTAPSAFEIARVEARDAPLELPERATGFRADAQDRLIGVLAEDERRADERQRSDAARRAVDRTRAPEPLYIGKDKQVSSESLAPSGAQLVAVIGASDASDGERDLMPVWLTDSADVETRRVRPHVGEAVRGAHELVWFDLESHTRVAVPLDALSGIDEDPLAELRSDEARSDEARSDEPRDAPRDVRLRLRDWSPDGRFLALQAYSTDLKDRWTLLLDAEDGALREVHRLHDPAWIGRFNEIGWVPGTSLLWFASEESGWSHLVLHDPDTGTTRALTSGEYEVSNVVPAPDGTGFYFRANRSDHGVHEVYRVGLGGAAPTRITSFGGSTEFELAPNGETLLCTVSRALEPPELYLVPARDSRPPLRITDTIEAAWRARPWVEPEYVSVPGTAGHAIPARLYRPAGAASEPRPAVLFVHGAGYLQNADRGWSGYQREFMFHTFLVQQGFVVLDLDYRASAGYGRDWRTAIFRHMGGPELDDLVDGARYLVEACGVDAERIGLYGGSYGGFLTLMALFLRSDVFACGAALRPVTDWAHYNDPYTANILHTPELDPEAYRRSSPIEFAEGLADPLLICHGLIDDNVLAKDSVRLAQRLIELGKQDFEVMLYPAEAHGFRHPSSWLDEYRRIWKLFRTHLAPAAAR